MTTKEIKLSVATAKDLMSGNRDQFREIVRDLLQELLEAEMTEALSAGKSERSTGRLGYRSGYYDRTLITRVGKLELRIPQDRDGHFWDCHEFRVWAGIMGKKETYYVTTQRACDPG